MIIIKLKYVKKKHLNILPQLKWTNSFMKNYGIIIENKF